MAEREHTQTIRLPESQYDGETSIEKALLKRRSVRTFRDESLTLEETSQLLWSAQGITNPRGNRAAPSAGALYPLETYIVVGNVRQLSPGVYRYTPSEHELRMIQEGDVRGALCKASLGQSSVRNAPLVLVFSAVYRRITSKYGERGIRYTWIEVGHVGQNVSLQAISLGLGSVMIGAFRDDEVKSVMKFGANEDPLYMIPIGR
ncbi:MAG: SagB/ThcOx family dehydrogenase [Pseudomonadota bacterium]